MPGTIGGDGAAASPGWSLRAALACCDTTAITMRAARLGIALKELQVSVNSSSDNRGLPGVGDDARPGPLPARDDAPAAVSGIAGVLR